MPWHESLPVFRAVLQGDVQVLLLLLGASDSMLAASMMITDDDDDHWWSLMMSDDDDSLHPPEVVFNMQQSPVSRLRLRAASRLTFIWRKPRPVEHWAARPLRRCQEWGRSLSVFCYFRWIISRWAAHTDQQINYEYLKFRGWGVGPECCCKLKTKTKFKCICRVKVRSKC